MPGTIIGTKHLALLMAFKEKFLAGFVCPPIAAFPASPMITPFICLHFFIKINLVLAEPPSYWFWTEKFVFIPPKASVTPQPFRFIHHSPTIILPIHLDGMTSSQRSSTRATSTTDRQRRWYRLWFIIPPSSICYTADNKSFCLPGLNRFLYAVKGILSTERIEDTLNIHME